MEERSKKVVEKMCKPIGQALAECFVSSMVMRCDFHYELAMRNGAEADDIPQIIKDAIESAELITKRFLDELSDVERATKFVKGEL